MKKLLFIVGFLFGAGLFSFAQDLITTKDGRDIEAKILEVTTTEVKYKRFNNLDGPIFTMSKNEILIVRYENGENEVFQSANRGYYGEKLNTTKTIKEGMKYKEYKDFYNPHLYLPREGDPYSRFWAGAASFFIPGLGECLDGQWGRGACFFIGNVALYAIQYSDTVYDSYGYSQSVGTIGTIAAIARIGVNIWSIVDAVRIAKIKNMYYQDLRALQAFNDVKVEPFFAFTPTEGYNGLTPVTGFTLKLNF